MSRHFYAAASLLLCAGCASGIIVDKFDGTQSTMTGVPYNLPMSAFTIKITRTVVGCSPTLDTQLQVDIVAGKSTDPAAMFTLRSEGIFETSDIKGTYDASGTSTGLTTETTDESAAILANVVSTVVKLAPLLVAAGAAGAPSGCTLEVTNALAALPALRERVASGAVELDKATRWLDALVARGGTDSKNKAPLDDAVTAQLRTADELRVREAQLSRTLGLLSHQETIEWPDNGLQLTGGPYSLPMSQLRKWAGFQINEPQQAIRKLDVYLQLKRTGRIRSTPALAATLSPVDASEAIPVRFSAPGRLVACAEKPCAEGGTESKVWDGRVLQLGMVYMMPTKGGAFRSPYLDLALEAEGHPSKIQTKQRTAAAKEATSQLKTAATDIAGLPAALSAARLARVKAESDLITAQNTIEKARAEGVTAAELAPIQAKATLLQAKIALLKAETDFATAQQK